MRYLQDRIFSFLICAFTALSFVSLLFVIYFIVREAMPLFSEVSPGEFIFGDRWMPIGYTGEPSFGIFNFIAATAAVSFLAIIIALFISIGAASFLCLCTGEGTREGIYSVIDLLAGIPSVVYGFIGIVVLLKIFLRVGVHTGSCVLAASILLSIMLLPVLISSCCESMLRARDEYLLPIKALGMSEWYGLATVIIPASWKNILLAVIPAVGRAMGETMAVMMVIGNANLFPSLLGKSETIPAVIALEMGTAVSGSTHYHALYGAGLVLMVMLFVINTAISILRRRLSRI